MKSFLTAGLALVSCAALAGIDENFNNVDTLPTGWSGDGTILVKSGDDKALSVNGSVICANAGTASQWAKTSFQLQAPVEETIELPSGSELANCQAAVATGEAVGDNLKVMIYCGSTPAWTDTNKTVPKGEWFTVALNFDYVEGKVQLLVNDKEAGWYTIVTAQATTSKIASLEFIGSALVDNVGVVEENIVPAEALPDAIKTLNVNLANLGLTVAEIKSDAIVGESGMTVAQKLEAGLDPKDDSTFTATAMGASSITIPCASDNGQVYTVVITDAAGNSVGTVEAAAGEIAAGKRTLTFTIPATTEKVLKFQVKASAPASTL